LEKFEYYIKELHPSDFFDSEIDIIKALKKSNKKIDIKLKGDKLLIKGENKDILNLCVTLDSIIYFLKNNANLNQSNLNQIINGKGESLLKDTNGRVILTERTKKRLRHTHLIRLKF
jgi:hypothetical protein